MQVLIQKNFEVILKIMRNTWNFVWKILKFVSPENGEPDSFGGRYTWTLNVYWNRYVLNYHA